MSDLYDMYEDKEYKEAVKEYADYAQRCRMLNEFDPNNRVFFNKRDEWAGKLLEIKEKYKTK